MERLYVTKPYLPKIEVYEKYLERIWQSHVLTNKGPLYIEFKEKLANIIDNKNINLFCNGHNALEIALKSLDMKEGGEIITTPFTFVSTTHAIINAGFKPVFCDIKVENMTIDENKIEELITDKTVAILPVHVYGFACNTQKIWEIAQKYHLKVIYDAAHAFGVKYNGKSLLNEGDISMISFHATKLFHTIEGGMTVSRESDISDRQEMLQNFGISGYESVSLIGGNAKMNEFSAAMGLATIDDLNQLIQKRKKLVDLYKKGLEGVKGITTFCHDTPNLEQNYAYFPIVIDEKQYGMDRNKVYSLLMENEIYSRKYFYPLTSDMECYREKYPEFLNSNLPVSRYVADRVLTLPMYYDLSEENVERICKVLRK